MAYVVGITDKADSTHAVFAECQVIGFNLFFSSGVDLNPPPETIIHKLSHLRKTVQTDFLRLRQVTHFTRERQMTRLTYDFCPLILKH